MASGTVAAEHAASEGGITLGAKNLYEDRERAGDEITVKKRSHDASRREAPF